MAYTLLHNEGGFKAAAANSMWMTYPAANPALEVGDVLIFGICADTVSDGVPAVDRVDHYNSLGSYVNMPMKVVSAFRDGYAAAAAVNTHLVIALVTPEFVASHQTGAGGQILRCVLTGAPAKSAYYGAVVRGLNYDTVSAQTSVTASNFVWAPTASATSWRIGALGTENNTGQTFLYSQNEWPSFSTGGGAAANVSVTLGLRNNANSTTSQMSYNTTYDGGGCYFLIDEVLPHTVTQAAYQFFADGTEAGSTALAAVNTAPSVNIGVSDADLALRVRLQESNVGPVPTTTDFQLQWEKNGSGTWTNVQPVPGTSALHDTFNDGTELGGSSTNPGTFSGQSFLGNGKLLTRAGFPMCKVGTPAGVIWSALWGHSGTYGSTGIGTVPALGESSQIVASSLSVAPTQWKYLDFDPPLSIDSGTPYVISLQADLVRSNHYISYGLRSTAGSHAGARQFFNGTTWTAQATSELLFEVWTADQVITGTVAPHLTTNIASRAPTTNRLSGGTGTFVPGKVAKTGQVDNLGWAQGGNTEVLFPIKLVQADLAEGDTLRFRVLRNGVPITYTVTPTLTAVASVGPQERFGTVTMTAASVLTPAAVKTTTATVTMTASSVVTANPTILKTYAGAATMTAPSILTAAATAAKVYAGAATMTAPSTMTAAATVTSVKAGAAVMTAASTLTAAATRAAPASVSMTAPSSTTIAAVRATAGLAAMTAPSTLAIGATRTTAAAVTMTAGSTFTAETSLSGTYLGAVSMTASSVLTIAAVRLTPATVAMTAPSSLVAAGVRAAVAAVSMTATSTLTSAVTAVRVVGVQMSTPSTLTAGVLRVTSATVTMTAPSILTAAATILVGGAFSPDVLPGLVIWLDASTLSLANDAEIFSWENLGSLPDPPIIGGSARMHTNALKGKPVVAFYAGQGRIRQSNIGVDLNWTVIYIARMMDNTGARIVTSQYPPANVLVGWWNFNMDVSYVEGFLTPDARKAQDLNWQLYTGAGEGVPGDARAWLYNNGVFLSGGHQVTGGWKDSFAINGYAPTTTEETGNFEVAEVVFYDRRLSDTERNQVEGYLYDKWLAVAPEFFGTVTMTAPSVLSTTAVRTAPATVTMSASSTLSTAAGRATAATVTMSAPSTLTTAAVRTTPATVTMTAASTLTPAAVRTTPATVVMTSPSVLTSTITPGAGGYAALTAPSVMTVVTSRETFGFVNMTAPATLSTAGTRTTQATVNMIAAAVLSVAALRITQGAVVMAASSVLTPAAIRTRYAAVTMQAMSNLLVNAVKFTPTNSPFWLWNGSLELPLNAAYWNGTSSENFTDYEIV